MGDYDYWTLIEKVGDEYKKKLKIGLLISYSYKREHFTTTNMKTGKSSFMCSGTYIGKTPKEWSSDKKTEYLKEQQKKIKELKISPAKERIIGNLLTIYCDSWAKPVIPLPDDFREFVEVTACDCNIGLDPNDDGEQEPECDEIIDSTGDAVIWTLMYLYRRGMITLKNVKELLKGQSYSTGCCGDYIKRLEKDFKMEINKK